MTGSSSDWIARFKNINNDRVQLYGIGRDVTWSIYRKILLEPILGMFHHN